LIAGDEAMSIGAFDGAEGVLSAEIFGVGLPADAERCLREAANSYDHDEIALAHLNEARRIAPSHVAVLIGLYRFFFYKGRISEALGIAHACFLRAAIDNSLPLDWRSVKREDADFGSFDAPLARFFMFVLKGYAYLQMRMGEVEEGREAIAKLLELDPSDKIGAQVLLGVLERMEADDDVD
jgi:tetratricopeptide (TPR) repeat protein